MKGEKRYECWKDVVKSRKMTERIIFLPLKVITQTGLIHNQKLPVKVTSPLGEAMFYVRMSIHPKRHSYFTVPKQIWDKLKLKHGQEVSVSFIFRSKYWRMKGKAYERIRWVLYVIMPMDLFRYMGLKACDRIKIGIRKV